MVRDIQRESTTTTSAKIMDLGLKDRVAIVTGASNGLGKSVARALARERARVVIAARTESRLREVSEEIRRETGGQVSAVAADLTRPESLRNLVEETVSRWGRLDIVVANAPGPPLAGFDAATVEHYERSIDSGLYSTVRLAKETIPHMRKARWGRFIALASVAAKRPLPDLILANTVRPALVGLIKSMASELAAHGVLCNVVAPGFIISRRVEDMVAEKADRERRDADEIWDEITERIPMGRLGSTDEVADVVAFLASERAAYVTGTTIPVDGGFVEGLF
jgi:3-oxoacyl-[acyl-carrier protein] reductase